MGFAGLCSGYHKTKVSVSKITFLSGGSGKIRFHAHSGCWQNSVPCGFRSEVPIFLLAIGQDSLSRLLKAVCISSHMAFFIFTPSNSTSSLSHALDLSDLPFCLLLLPPFSTSWRSFSTFQDSRDYIRLPFLLPPSYNLSFLKSTVPFYIAQSQE